MPLYYVRQIIFLSFLFVCVKPVYASQMETGAIVTPPLEYVRFCALNLPECQMSKKTAVPRELDATAWRDLLEVQELTHRLIKATPDYTVWGKADRWSYPVDNQADCEDFSLFKRRQLIGRGWDPQTLLLTTAVTEKGEYHVVLTALTSGGEFILDNRTPFVLGWEYMPYRWLARQHPSNPLRWVALTGKEKQRLAALNN
jgi:predicted transglutaminase-like cysteine proteinase